MDNQSVSLFNTDPAFIDLQRRQQLAQALAQQADKPDQLFQGPMGQAPIPSYSPIAHGLRSFLAAALQKKVSDDTATAQQQQRQQAADTIKSLYSPGGQTLQSTDVSFPGQTISAQAPSMPGGGAPLPAATAQLPAASAPGASMQTAPQGPTGAELAQLMTNPNPYLQNVVPAMFQNQMSRDTAQWERGLPMSQAQKDQIELQGKTTLGNEEASAKFNNGLPVTAQQAAQNKIEQDKNAIERQKAAELQRYHNLMTGQGLTEDGQPNPAVQSWVADIARGNAQIQNVPSGIRSAVAIAMNRAPKEIFTPLAGARFGLESNRIVANYLKLPEYANTANGLQYLSRIDAALKEPGSVTDQELLDSLTKLNTAGNAITDAQVRIITDGKSVSDWAGIELQKLKTGGVLSTSQRAQIRDVANRTYQNYKKSYEPVYQEAAQKLTDAGVPKAFWTIPDLNNLRAGQDTAGGNAAAPGTVAPKGQTAAPPQSNGGVTVVRTGTDKATGKRVKQYSDGSIQYGN